MGDSNPTDCKAEFHVNGTTEGKSGLLPNSLGDAGTEFAQVKLADAYFSVLEPILTTEANNRCKVMAESSGRDCKTAKLVPQWSKYVTLHHESNDPLKMHGQDGEAGSFRIVAKVAMVGRFKCTCGDEKKDREQERARDLKRVAEKEAEERRAREAADHLKSGGYVSPDLLGDIVRDIGRGLRGLLDHIPNPNDFLPGLPVPGRGYKPGF
ncbi:MAG: hypothetical protein HY293_10690 [Planctomycetes bacterium]|nr:hypothetical protein [Planctomycetota bacterium]